MWLNESIVKCGRCVLQASKMFTGVSMKPEDIWERALWRGWVLCSYEMFSRHKPSAVGLRKSWVDGGGVELYRSHSG